MADKPKKENVRNRRSIARSPEAAWYFNQTRWTRTPDDLMAVREFKALDGSMVKANLSDKCVLAFLLRLLNKDNVAWPNLATIARQLGMAKSVAQVAIDRLESLGIVKPIPKALDRPEDAPAPAVDERKFYRSNEYKFSWLNYYKAIQTDARVRFMAGMAGLNMEISLVKDNDWRVLPSARTVANVRKFVNANNTWLREYLGLAPIESRIEGSPPASEPSKPKEKEKKQ